MAEALLEIRDLKKYFPIRGGLWQRKVNDIHAVDGVDLAIQAGESFGLVGESGSGKTTLGKTILRLSEPTTGQIIFEGTDLVPLPEQEMQRYREDMQMVFQDPYSSLNPRMKVKDIVVEPLLIHKRGTTREAVQRARELIRLVGLMDDHLHRFPHEFSGGQRQRIGIARAIALNPKLLVLDEPTSALDVSVQAQVLNLLLDLQHKLDLTYLFISHDLGVIRYVCNRVGLMYLGRVVEMASVDQIFEEPKHPYTVALLSSMPEPDPDSKVKEIILEGEIGSPINLARGCRFAPRCPLRFDRCLVEDPPLLHTGDNHWVACHLHPGLPASQVASAANG
ncbi:MAG: ABC transporter ATP-binding protein [Chloroflexi bacterium]|nr:MAG: ABC transporter ATP-binding protein [Chloroflexota bacterium]